MSLEGFVDSKFQSSNVAQIGMMVLAESAEESSFDLIHRRSVFFNINVSIMEMSQDWLFQCPQSERKGHGNTTGCSVGKMVFKLIHRPIGV